VHLVNISDSTTKNGINQEARFSKKKRSTPKQTGQILLENWQRKSDARSCYECLLPGHIAADCTTDKGKATAYSMLDLRNPHVLAGAEWWTEEYMPRLLACVWDPIKDVTSSTTSGFGDGPKSTLLCVAKAVPFRLWHHDGSTTLYFSDVAIA
jgi:hypothetical protein